MSICDAPDDKELEGLAGLTATQANQSLAETNPDVVTQNSFIAPDGLTGQSLQKDRVLIESTIFDDAIDLNNVLISGALKAYIESLSGTTFTVEAGITAGTTQTQAGGYALTKSFNEIETVANDNDTVTLPGASAGSLMMIAHNGDNDLRIFPADGDNFEGLAGNASITMRPESENSNGINSLLWAQDDATWQYLNSIITGYGTAGLSASEVYPIPYWGKTGTGGTGKTTGQILSGEQIDSGFISAVDIASSELLIHHQFSSTTKNLRFFLNNSSSNSDADVICQLETAGSGGDSMVRWSQSGGGGTYFNLGRDRADGSNWLKATYGTDMDDTTLFEVNTTGGFHFAEQSGLTASTTQTQGEQPLTRTFNEVSTVSNTNDVVTMPAARSGYFVCIQNNGANTLQIFPASGDQMGGASIDASITLAAGNMLFCFASGDTAWQYATIT